MTGIPVILRMRARGPFSLGAAARFSEEFPAGQGGGDEPRLDLAFPADRGGSAVGVRVTQDGADVIARVVADPGGVSPADVRGQVERILALDVDGTGFLAVGEHDPVVGELQRRRPGLRPVQFHSPYEAAAWAIIGQRIRMTQAAVIRTRIAERLGETMDFGDRTLPAFPAPGRLAELGEFPGLTGRKIDQLRALGRAADEGLLDAAELRALPVEEALTHLRALPGVGPFSAELVLLRGAGHPDVFPAHEKRLHRAMAALYDLGEDPSLDALRAVADGWRPYRTWTALLLRVWLEDQTHEIATGRRVMDLPDRVDPDR
nr:DNA-3-methyladenine glycosylase 2 family protein [Nakamurella flavida]